MYTGPPAKPKRNSFELKGPRIIQFSTDGKKLFDVTSNVINVYDTKQCEVINQIQRHEVSSISISPKGNYLLTWETFPANSTNPNTFLYDISTNPPTIIYSYIQKVHLKEHWPTVQFTEDEQFFW